MPQDFADLTYHGQIRRLRLLAAVALAKYPLRVRGLEFINHGENTTFKVTAREGRFLLRIHRKGYHTPAAIEEELNWLSLLSKKGLSVPKPLKSRAGAFLETAEHPLMNTPREVCVFKWNDGKVIRGGDVKYTPELFFETGKLLGRIQNQTPRGKPRYRVYWDTEGLVGRGPKFGSIDKLKDTTPAQQKLISKMRHRAYGKLKWFEKKFPKRMGLIHADLHFGNLLKTPKGLAAIDFDDGGYGFHAYDLAIPLVAAEGLFERGELDAAASTAALIAGFKTERPWDNHDDGILPVLMIARKLMMLGWLNSRTDNPRLAAYLKTAVKNTVASFKKMT